MVMFCILFYHQKQKPFFFSTFLPFSLPSDRMNVDFLVQSCFIIFGLHQFYHRYPSFLYSFIFAIGKFKFIQMQIGPSFKINENDSSQNVWKVLFYYDVLLLLILLFRNQWIKWSFFLFYSFLLLLFLSLFFFV